MSEEKEFKESLQSLSEKLKADVIMYSGRIDRAGSTELMEITANPTNKNVILFLCTFGGDPNAAYRIAKRLQTKYEKFYLCVHGFCKSAGTLIAIGSDEISMGELAEFGPLDIQVSDGEEIGRLSSGLNVFESLRALNSQYHSYFQDSLMELLHDGSLSTKNAAPIAASLASGFFTPILSNLDPVKIGELGRAMKIGIEYGKELIKTGRGNIRTAQLLDLSTQYPDHGYLIDIWQAAEIFETVRESTELEETVAVGIEELKFPFMPENATSKRQKVVLLYGKEKADDSKKKRGARGASKKASRATKDERSNISELKPKDASS